MLLQHLSQAITTLVNDIEKQETNDTELQDMLFGYATYTILSNAAKKFKRFEDQIKEENKDVWEKEYKSLIKQEVEIEIPEIKLADFGDIKIAPSQLVGLDWLIKE